MRRAVPPPLPTEALQQFQTMQRDGMGVKLMLPYLPQGASLEDAHRLYKRLGQESRTPCTILDAPLGIRRD
jgi:hypothetical protein